MASDGVTVVYSGAFLHGKPVSSEPLAFPFPPVSSSAEAPDSSP